MGEFYNMYQSNFEKKITCHIYCSKIVKDLEHMTNAKKN